MECKGFHTSKGIGALYDGIVILGGCRTPFGEFCQGLSRVNPTDLGILASRETLKKCQVDPSWIDQVIFANVGQSGPDAYYLARHIALYSGIPLERPASMVQRICGSGFEVIIQAAEQIALGKADFVLVGGTENMSLNPIASFTARMGFDLGRPTFVDTLWEELRDPACNCLMGQTAENLVKQYHISREEVDRYALESQNRYQKAKKRGFFEDELFPIHPQTITQPGLEARKVKLPRRVKVVAEDEHPRETTLEKLSQLKPVFSPEGVQTAGNSSGICDGACALVITHEGTASKWRQPPLGKLLASASTGVPPEIMGIGPAPAIQLLLEKAGVKKEEVDLFEINEAFAGQILAVIKEAQLNREKVNPNGGAIAIGHPLAATGARLTLTLLRQLKEKNGKYGVASACIGGGQGTALLVQPYQ